MRSNELDEAIAIVRRLIATSRNKGVVTDPRLRTALRELEMLKKGGKLDRRRLGHAVKLISSVLADEMLREDLWAMKKSVR
jgi:hypothetical protein